MTLLIELLRVASSLHGATTVYGVLPKPSVPLGVSDPSVRNRHTCSKHRPPGHGEGADQGQHTIRTTRLTNVARGVENTILAPMLPGQFDSAA